MLLARMQSRMPKCLSRSGLRATSSQKQVNVAFNVSPVHVLVCFSFRENPLEAGDVLAVVMPSGQVAEHMQVSRHVRNLFARL